MKSLKEVYFSKKVKTLNSRSLRKIILEEVRLLAEEEKEAETQFAAVTTATNIKDLDTADAYAQLTSGDENAPLIQAMLNATGWGSGAIKGAGGVKGIKDWAEGIGEAELSKRISTVGDDLPSGAPAKKDMPALEGEDATAVADALTPGGKFNIDLEPPHAKDENFDTWYDSLTDEEKASYESGKVPKAEQVKEEGLVREDKYPRHGMAAMPGGAAENPVGKALAFLTKGQMDGEDGDDKITVTTGGSLANSKMIPTQSNILAGKSLLFAFLQGVGASDLSDMGGAFVTSAGEILDGHHRWSGAYIGTGGGLTHSNVHVVDGDSDSLIPMLTSVGNALGRPQKESKKSNDDLIVERWKRLAGIL
jgi:hypothetical protein